MAGFGTGFAQGFTPAFNDSYTRSYSEMKAFFDDRAQRKTAQAAAGEFEKKRLAAKAGLDLATKEVQELTAEAKLEQDPVAREMRMAELAQKNKYLPLTRQQYYSSVQEMAVAELGRNIGNPHAESYFGKVLDTNDRELSQWGQSLIVSEQRGMEQLNQLEQIKAQGGENRTTQAANIEGAAAEGQRSREFEGGQAAAQRGLVASEGKLGRESQASLQTSAQQGQQAQAGLEHSLALTRDELTFAREQGSPQKQMEVVTGAMGLLEAMKNIGLQPDQMDAVLARVPALSENGITASDLTERYAGYGDDTRTKLSALEKKRLTLRDKLEKQPDERVAKQVAMISKQIDLLQAVEDRQMEAEMQWSQELAGATEFEEIAQKANRWIGEVGRTGLTYLAAPVMVPFKMAQDIAKRGMAPEGERAQLLPRPEKEAARDVLGGGQ